MTPDKPPVLELNSVTKLFKGPKRHEEIAAVENMNLVLPDENEGELVALIGPSGCGKSTLLSMISGLSAPTSGEVKIYGEPVGNGSKLTVTVQQAYTCFPWLTAQKNVEFALKVQGSSTKEAMEVSADYLQKVGLGDRLTAMPHELSGGMQQRIAIARALAVKRKIVLMDEPFGALDAQTRADMQQLLLKLWMDEKNTVLFVTHDISEAVLLAQRVVVLSPRPGRIVHDMRIPFPYPRATEVSNTEDFQEICHLLLTVLKNQHGSQPESAT